MEKYLLPTVYDFANELSIQRIIEAEAEPILNAFRSQSSRGAEDLSLNTDMSEKPQRNEELFSLTAFGVPKSPQEASLSMVSDSQKMQTELTDAEKRALILENAGKIRGC